MIGTGAVAYVRDRFTWMAYAALAYFAYLEAVPGPIMPFLRDDLGLSYTVGGLHFSAFALGLILGGLAADRVVGRWGRPAAFWIGGAGMALGAVGLGLGRHPALTIFSTFVMGAIGSQLLSAIQAGLSDHHGERRTIALTESNIVASMTTGLAPFFVGAFQRAGIGWRGALYLMAIVWLAIMLAGRRTAIPAARPRRARSAEQRHEDRLPAVFWMYVLVLVFCVAVEWTIAVWGADFLISAADLRKADASLVMTLYYVAMVIARIAGSWLARRVPMSRLVVLALAIGIAGFALFWRGPSTALHVLGLFVAGLGIANLYPFLMSIGVTVAGERSDTGSARIVVGVGTAMLIAPQILGSAADRIGIQDAYGLVGLILLLATGAALLANRMAARQNGGAKAV